MAEDLVNAPIDPSIVNDAELEQIYRGALEEKARPYEEQAANAFERCRTVAAEHGIDSKLSRRCAVALRHMGR